MTLAEVMDVTSRSRDIVDEYKKTKDQFYLDLYQFQEEVAEDKVCITFKDTLKEIVITARDILDWNEDLHNKLKKEFQCKLTGFKKVEELMYNEKHDVHFEYYYTVKSSIFKEIEYEKLEMFI